VGDQAKEHLGKLVAGGTHVNLALLLALGAATAWEPAAAQTPRSVLINPILPEEQLADALNKLARQSGFQVMFPSSIVAGRRSPRVTGSLSIHEALQKLLINSRLRFDLVNARTVTILNGATPVPKPRLRPPQKGPQSHSNNAIGKSDEVRR
jgi:hypothetical protein